MFDRESASQVAQQGVLFIMAVSNSCINPLVYGAYNLKLQNELLKCFGCKKDDEVLLRRPTGLYYNVILIISSEMP